MVKISPTKPSKSGFKEAPPGTRTNLSAYSHQLENRPKVAKGQLYKIGGAVFAEHFPELRQAAYKAPAPPGLAVPYASHNPIVAAKRNGVASRGSR